MAVTTALATMVSLVVTLCLLEGLSLMAAAVPTALAMMVSLVVTLWLLEGLSLMAVAMVASAGGRPRAQPPRSEP